MRNIFESEHLRLHTSRVLRPERPSSFITEDIIRHCRSKYGKSALWVTSHSGMSGNYLLSRLFVCLVGPQWTRSSVIGVRHPQAAEKTFYRVFLLNHGTQRLLSSSFSSFIIKQWSPSNGSFCLTCVSFLINHLSYRHSMPQFIAFTFSFSLLVQCSNFVAFVTNFNLPLSSVITPQYAQHLKL